MTSTEYYKYDKKIRQLIFDNALSSYRNSLVKWVATYHMGNYIFEETGATEYEARNKLAKELSKSKFIQSRFK